MYNLNTIIPKTLKAHTKTHSNIVSYVVFMIMGRKFRA